MIKLMVLLAIYLYGNSWVQMHRLTVLWFRLWNLIIWKVPETIKISKAGY